MYYFDDEHDDGANNTVFMDDEYNGRHMSFMPYFIMIIPCVIVIFAAQFKEKMCHRTEKAVLIDRDSIIPIATVEVMDEFPSDIESQITLSEENKVDETSVIIAVNQSMSESS